MQFWQNQMQIKTKEATKMARTKKVTAPEAQEVVSEVATEETFGSFIAPDSPPALRHTA